MCGACRLNPGMVLMLTVTSVDWRQFYRSALHSAQEAAAHQTSRAACGFTNNVDIVIQVTPEALAPFRALPSAVLTGTLPQSLNTPLDLANALLYFARHGVGGELQIVNPALGAWIRAHFDGPTEIGGTGARAANAMACLGFETVMHVTGLSELEAEYHEPSGRLTIAFGGRLLPPVEAVRPGDEAMFHLIFEYQADVPLDFGVAVVVPSESNRIITYYDPLNLAVKLDADYLAAINEPANRIDRVLVSGFNQMERAEQAQARVTSLLAHIRRWRTRPILIHVELASILDPGIAETILGTLAPAVDSLGFNADEIPIVAEAVGLPAPQDIVDCLDVMARFKAQARLHRINLHTQLYCLSVIGGDPAAERQALLFASLVASTRALMGHYPSLSVLERVLNDHPVRAASQVYEARLASHCDLVDGIGHSEAGSVVYVPTLRVDHPVTTVGLGDTYTGALLSMLKPT